MSKAQFLRGISKKRRTGWCVRRPTASVAVVQVVGVAARTGPALRGH